MSRYTPRNFKYCDSDFMDSGLAEPMNKLAHYEDLEEQGRLIELPCKVGEKAWYIKGKSVHWLIFDYEWLGYYKPEELFATKEEAEKALAELKGE